MKKKILITILCFGLFGCKEMGNILVNNLIDNTIGKHIPDHMKNTQKNYAVINQAHKMFVYITAIPVNITYNKKKFDYVDEKEIKFYKNNINKETMLEEMKQMAIARYPDKIIVVKFDDKELHGSKEQYDPLNKNPNQKYAYFEYRQLKEKYNAEIVVQLELYQYIDITDNPIGGFEYKISSSLDTSFISTLDNSFLYNENLKSNLSVTEKTPYFELNNVFFNVFKNSYTDLTRSALQ